MDISTSHSHGPPVMANLPPRGNAGPKTDPPALVEDVHLLIVKEIIARSPQRLCLGLSKYAVVSRSWQREVEKRTFAQLSLDVHSLTQFPRVCVGDRLNYITKITLRIAAGAGYRFREYIWANPIGHMSRVVATAVRRLFAVFTHCRMQDRATPAPLEFEIGISSYTMDGQTTKTFLEHLYPRGHEYPGNLDAELALPVRFYGHLDPVNVVGICCFHVPPGMGRPRQEDVREYHLDPDSVAEILGCLPNVATVRVDLPPCAQSQRPRPAPGAVHVAARRIKDMMQKLASLTHNFTHLSLTCRDYDTFDHVALTAQYLFPLGAKLTQLELRDMMDIPLFLRAVIMESRNLQAPATVWPVLTRLWLQAADRDYSGVEIRDTMKLFARALPSMPALRFATISSWVGTTVLELDLDARTETIGNMTAPFQITLHGWPQPGREMQELLDVLKVTSDCLANVKFCEYFYEGSAEPYGSSDWMVAAIRGQVIDTNPDLGS